MAEPCRYTAVVVSVVVVVVVFVVCVCVCVWLRKSAGSCTRM